MDDYYDYSSGSESESYTDTDDAPPDPRAGGYRIAANRPIHVVLTPREIHQRLSKEAAAAAEVFSVTTDSALALLTHYRWNPMRLQDDWFAGDQDSIRAAAGLGLGDDHPAGPEETTMTCGICTEAKPAAEMASAGCAHRYCHGCWRGYVAAALEESGGGGGARCLALRCPDASCSRAVLRGAVERFATRAGRRAYARQLARAYVEARRLWLRPCTAPRCGCAVEVPRDTTDDGADGDVRCRCGNAFCWRCGGAAHWPASCAEVARWAREADAASADWMLLHTKRCPRCERPIERADGCRRMICAEPCNHFFCWVCLGPTAVGTWGDHDACCDDDGGGGGSEKKHSPEQARAKEALDRFLHYQNLWMGNLSKQRNAEAELRRLRGKKLPGERRAVARAYLTSVAKAWEQVAEGRRVLGNACAHGQRLRQEAAAADKARWELYEFQHGQADAVLQRLQHRAMEAPATQVERMEELGAQLESLTMVTRRCVHNFVKALQEGSPAAQRNAG